MTGPTTESELAEAIRAAKAPLAIRGGGTRPIGHPVAGDPLSIAKLNGITLYEPGALTLVAKAGTPLAEVEAALAAEGQRLPFEPMDHRALLGTEGTPTIGGMVAANVSGPRRIQAGACRDSLIGVRYVDGMGTAVKNGGRVMKNVTGYDLVKLLAGSYGTLGVLSEVSFKVLPVPETQTTLVLQTQTAAQAVKAMAKALGSPFEVSGAAHGPLSGAGAPTYLRLEGFAKSVDYRSKALQSLLAEFGEITVKSDPAASAALWANIRDVSAFQDRTFVARLSIKPSDLPALHSDLADTFSDTSSNAANFDMMVDWGGGLVWVAASQAQLEQIAQSPTDATRPGVQTLLRHLQAFCQDKGGHATLIKAPDALRRSAAVFQPEAAPLQAITTALRAKFDPRGILNPGLMG